MPLTKTNSGNAIRGLVPVNNAVRSQCQGVIAQFVYADLGRGAGTLHTNGNARLDMQGKTATGASNLQVQVGGGSVAAAIVDASVLQTSDAQNQAGVKNAVISILNQSMDSGTVWNLTGKLP
jgi:hypothetical protein